ncbi:MAG: hypothetical protein KBS34_05535, partial [Phascolarctobacterium sp.]|nr:hypothetical protein [Candidatus Phascolarctobacterium equi]
GNTQLYEVKNNSRDVPGRIEKGIVNINSQNGSVVQNSAAIYGATVNLSAKNDLKNIVITAGDSIDFTGTITGNGSANVVITNNYQAKGDVVMHNFGGTDANGVALTASGNIHQATVNDLVRADRIDLVSENGEIAGLNDKAMYIQGGQSDAVVGSDTMLASVNAQAKGDVYLIQTQGDLRVGTIYSDNGDVKVGVPYGGIVDALPYESRTDRISDEELLAQWREMGMIVGGDADLIAQKEAVLKKTNGDDATYSLWNSDQLLYSIQDKIINRDSGVVVPTNGKAVNFYGKNITMLVKDGTGLNSDRVRTVDLLTLGDMDSKGNLIHLDDLKALSTADASTVEWKASENKAYIRERMAIGLQQSNNPDGAITIFKYTNEDQGQSNIFVESRQRKDIDAAVQQNYDMRLYMAYTTQGDVQFNTWGNLYSAMNTESVPVILGKNIVINTGAEGETSPFGSIGTADKPMTIALGGGNLAATATGNIYLANDDANPLKIASITAGRSGGTFSADSGNIYLTSTSDIYLIKKDSNIQGFIRTNNNGEVFLHSDASIGSVDNPVRILNSNIDQGIAGFAAKEGVVSLTAGNDIYVEGVSTEDYTPVTLEQAAGGYLNIAELSSTAGDVVITLNGILNLKSDVNLPGKFALNINTDAELNKNITAKDIEITATNNIVLTNGITLKAENVILTAGQKPVLSYGTVATSLTEGASIRQGESFNYGYIKEAMDFSASGHAQAVFDSISKIQANHLQASATTGIYLRGKNDCNDVVLHNVQEHVVYHNVADVDPLESGDVLTVNISDANATDGQSHPVIGSVWVYNQAITPATSSENFAKPMAVTDGIYSLGDVVVKTDGRLANLMEVTSKQGNIYLGSELETVNRGMIKAEEGYVAIGADGISNYADIEAKNSIFLLSSQGIYNGELLLTGENNEQPMVSSEQATVDDIHMYAGDDIVLLPVNGLDNRADLVAGVDVSGGTLGLGGNVFLDDFEIVNTNVLPQDTKEFLQLLMQNYWEQEKTHQSNAPIKNSGVILAYKGNQGDGRVYVNSQGMTENEGDIYSVNGAVFMDSSEDLINHQNIYVVNTKEDGSSCDVTLQATGNVYNTGDIYVQGKGAVLLDADAVDVDKLDLEHMTPEQIAVHVKTSTLEGHTFKGVYNTGDIYASNGNVTFISAYGGDIYNTDALNTVTDDDITGASSVVYSQGSIALLAPMGHIENTKALYATKNITIECVDDLYNAPAETSDVPSEYGGHTILRGLEAGAGTDGSGDLKLISHNGVIYNDGILKATRGDVIVDAGGAKVFSDVVFEIDDTICPVPLNGKTKFENESYSIINT